jgi:hypothetical protein
MQFCTEEEVLVTCNHYLYMWSIQATLFEELMIVEHIQTKTLFFIQYLEFI